MPSPRHGDQPTPLPAHRPWYALGDVSVAPLVPVPALLRELGTDPAAVFERAGLEIEVLSDAANRLPFTVAGRLLENCAAASACPHFGLLLGMRAGLTAVGIAGGILQNAETVHAALRLFIAHQHLHDRGGFATLSVGTSGEAELSYRIHHPGTPGAAQIMDLSMAVACALMRRLCGPRWAPTAVMLSHARPRSMEPYQRYFRAPVTADAPSSALVFPTSCLSQVVAGADPTERDRLLRLAADLDAARPSSVTELTVRALSCIVVSAPPSAGKVAKLLGMKPRSLRKRLEAEGSSIKALLEDLRCELARQLLEESRLPIGEISATLHYSRPGAFTRAFKAWTGSTPRAWRNSFARGTRPSGTGQHSP